MKKCKLVTFGLGHGCWAGLRIAKIALLRFNLYYTEFTHSGGKPKTSSEQQFCGWRRLVDEGD